MEWYEKYNEKSFDKIVIPASIKNLILESYANGVKHFMFYSSVPGVGKTMLAGIIAEFTGREFLEIGGGTAGSTKSEIEHNVKTFASKRYKCGKLCVINEGHRMTSIQQGPLVTILDDLSSKNTSLIITTNDMNSMDEFLRSRMTYINFDYNTEEHRKEVVPGFKNRLIEIAGREGAEYKGEVIDALINDNFPSMRDMVKDMQTLFLSQGHLNTYTKQVKTNINILAILAKNDFNTAFEELVIHQLVNERVYGYVRNLLKGKKMTKSVAKIIKLCKQGAIDHSITVDKDLNIYCFLIELSELIREMSASSTSKKMIPK